MDDAGLAKLRRYAALSILFHLHLTVARPFTFSSDFSPRTSLFCGLVTTIVVTLILQPPTPPSSPPCRICDCWARVQLRYCYLHAYRQRDPIRSAASDQNSPINAQGSVCHSLFTSYCIRIASSLLHLLW